jgi:hypothetical protein
MRQILLPFYEPYFTAPERAVLTLLHSALHVTEYSLRDAHPTVGVIPSSEPPTDPPAAVVTSAARLIVGRCVELRELLDFYDSVVDGPRSPIDDPIPF